MLKTHCVTNLRASTQRCACCVLELLRFFGFLVLGSPKTKKTKNQKKHSHLSLVLSPWGLLLVYFFFFVLGSPKTKKPKKTQSSVSCPFTLGSPIGLFFFFVLGSPKTKKPKKTQSSVSCPFTLGSPIGLFFLSFLFFWFPISLINYFLK